MKIHRILRLAKEIIEFQGRHKIHRIQGWQKNPLDSEIGKYIRRILRSAKKILSDSKIGKKDPSDSKISKKIHQNPRSAKNPSVSEIGKKSIEF